MATPEAASLLHHAASLFRDGRYAEAIPAYEQLLRLCPDLPNSWFNLALAQRRMRRFEDSLASYQRALDLGIDAPEEVHLQRGVILSDELGQSEAARGELEAALALNRDYLPALLNLGNLHEDGGDRAAARGAYAHAHRLDPGNALALARLVGVTELETPADPLLSEVRSALADRRSAPEDRADLGFALGSALDRLGAYDDAFAAYRAANGASRELLQRAGVQYDPAAAERFVQRLIGSFPWPSASPPNPASPIFICGMFRSGSTLTEQILARHSAVSAGGELDILPALIRDRLGGYPGFVPSTDSLADMAAAYLADARPHHAPGSRLTDKRPDNVLHIGLIKAIFPTARIVHTVRNRIDNCLAVYFLHAGTGIPYATELREIAHYYDQQHRLMAHWRRLWPDDILDLDYDRLVQAPRREIEALLRFCGLQWEDAVEAPRLSAGAVRTASHWQVREPLYQRSSGRWRNYRAHLGALLDSA